MASVRNPLGSPRILYPDGVSGDPAPPTGRGIGITTPGAGGATNRTATRMGGTAAPLAELPISQAPPTTPGSGTAAPTNPYAPATNAFKPYTLYDGEVPYTTQSPGVYGSPTVNPDGSVSAARPDNFGAFGFDPYMNWSGINSDNGQAWNLGNSYLNDQGAQRLIELLGLSGAPVQTATGSIQNWMDSPGTIFSPTSGTTAGPQGQGMWRYVDPTTNQLVDLTAFAPYFINGKDDIGQYLFDNIGNAEVQRALGYVIPDQYNNVNDLQNAINSTIYGLNNPTIPVPPGAAPIPVGGGNNTPGGSTPGGSNTGGNSFDNILQLLQGIWSGSSPFTIEQLLGGGTLGAPGAPYGQDYLDGLSVLGNFSGASGLEQLLNSLTAKNLFDVSPTGMYAQLGPAAYLQRQLYPEYFI